MVDRCKSRRLDPLIQSKCKGFPPTHESEQLGCGSGVTTPLVELASCARWKIRRTNRGFPSTLKNLSATLGIIQGAIHDLGMMRRREKVGPRSMACRLMRRGSCLKSCSKRSHLTIGGQFEQAWIPFSRILCPRVASSVQDDAWKMYAGKEDPLSISSIFEIQMDCKEHEEMYVLEIFHATLSENGNGISS
uniref:Uncharacterized protein n=1 Tax=Cannabis sativa TaxID=3483 RepID=A0A803P3M0_CANSA